MNIRHLRKARGLTQVELSEMTRIPQATLSRAENMDDGATLSTYRQIAEALQVSLADLFATERSAAEQALIEQFRRLDPNRQKVWFRLAEAFLDEGPQAPG